jgi:hypothetical protein
MQFRDHRRRANGFDPTHAKGRGQELTRKGKRHKSGPNHHGVASKGHKSGPNHRGVASKGHKSGPNHRGVASKGHKSGPFSPLCIFGLTSQYPCRANPCHNFETPSDTFSLPNPCQCLNQVSGLLHSHRTSARFFLSAKAYVFW